MRAQSRVLILFFCAACVGLEAQAGEESKVSSLPFSGFVVDLGAKDKRAELGLYRSLQEGRAIRFQVSAPLDEKTQKAEFLTENRLATGVNGSLAFEYSSSFENLSSVGAIVGHTAVAGNQVKICQALGVEDPCTQDKICVKMELPADCTEEQLNQGFNARRDAVCKTLGLQDACTQDQICGKLDLAAGCTMDQLNAKLESRHKQLCEGLGEAATCSQEQICTKLKLSKTCMPEDVNKALDAFLSQRHISFPTYKGWTYVLGVEASGEFNRIEAHGADVAGKAAKYNSGTFGVTPFARLFLGDNTALSLRLGGTYGRSVKVREAERCTAETSSDPAITARGCKTVNVLEKKGDFQTAGNISLSVTRLIGQSVGGFRPGVDGWLNFKNISLDEEQVEFRVLAFFAPDTNPLGIRSGLGLSVNAPTQTILDANGEEVTKAWRPNFDPYVVIGGTFD